MEFVMALGRLVIATALFLGIPILWAILLNARDRRRNRLRELVLAGVHSRELRGRTAVEIRCPLLWPAKRCPDQGARLIAPGDVGHRQSPRRAPLPSGPPRGGWGPPGQVRGRDGPRADAASGLTPLLRDSFDGASRGSSSGPGDDDREGVTMDLIVQLKLMVLGGLLAVFLVAAGPLLVLSWLLERRDRRRARPRERAGPAVGGAWFWRRGWLPIIKRWEVRPMRTKALLLSAVVALYALAGGAGWAQQGFKATPVFKGSTTIGGQKIQYPNTDKPEVFAALIEIAPGGEAGRHMHPVPLYVHVLEGTLTVEVEGKGRRDFPAGTGFLEVVNTWHNGLNLGSVPVKFLVVFVSEEGKQNLIRP